MLKRIITPESKVAPPDAGAWLDLDRLAEVEVTSEDERHPIESALVGEPRSGWRAAGPGEQIVRLTFANPLRLRRVHLAFHETEHPRTQEFVLRWSADGGSTYRDVVRQQYTFSPPDTSHELEDYRVELDGVTTLELRIVPNMSGGAPRASLGEWRLA
jgi:hypothetical protein